MVSAVSLCLFFIPSGVSKKSQAKFSFSELPSSFVDQRLANTKYFHAAITKEPKCDKLDLVKDFKRMNSLDLTKSVINNDPIFMIYSKADPKPQNVAKPATEEPAKKRKSLWTAPTGDRARIIWWIYTWPIKLILTMTIPNPKTYRRLYPLTFLMCIIWIGLNAYMIVWMITVMGKCSCSCSSISCGSKPRSINKFRE